MEVTSGLGLKTGGTLVNDIAGEDVMAVLSGTGDFRFAKPILFGGEREDGCGKFGDDVYLPLILCGKLIGAGYGMRDVEGVCSSHWKYL
jgi:hypothetical protein